MVGGDVITQDCQRTHIGQSAWCSQRAFPIWRTSNIGTLWAPVVQWAFGLFNLTQIKHRNIHFTELFRLHRFFDQCINFGIGWPDVFEVNGVTVLVGAEYIFFDIKTNGAGNRIRHHKRWRCQKGLFCIWMNTPVEVTVARKYSRCIQITVDNFLLNNWI